MRWLPHMQIYGTAISEDDREIEGRTLSISWFGFVVEITLAREVSYV